MVVLNGRSGVLAPEINDPVVVNEQPHGSFGDNTQNIFAGRWDHHPGPSN